jgi:protoporphyrinogen oxidase
MSPQPEKIAVIIGAGPAGLTAAAELLARTDIRPLLFEASDEIGGISKTVNFKGNRIDIGGHRFFSRSEWVMAWWQRRLPVMGAPARDDLLLERSVPLSALAGAPDPEREDRVMLRRRRISRIFFLRSFFDYPITLNAATLKNLGPVRLVRIGLSYLKACLLPIREERSLEDFFVNRFGGELYRTFFKDYTEKVWGVPCRAIRPEWGAQRIKGLSVTRALLHALRSRFSRDDSIAQRETETSLIGQFLYPKLGPGQLWQTVAEEVAAAGGELRLGWRVVGVEAQGARVVGVTVEDPRSGARERIAADYVFSSMPLKELAAGFSPPPPQAVREVAQGLRYRDFITVGLLVRRLRIGNESAWQTVNGILPDNWIYIQERDVRLGRLQIFNNWSPYLVADPERVWLGLEYFCNEGDELWRLDDAAMVQLGIDELARIEILDPAAVVDGTVIRVPKAYPAYFGSYNRFDEVRDFFDRFENLYLIGRNGMHRYNNMDHSMLAARLAVDHVAGKLADKSELWKVNAEEDYHEGKAG